MLPLELAYEAAEARTRLRLRLTCRDLRLPQVGLASHADIARARRAVTRWRERPRARRCSWIRRRVRTDDTPIL
jgi:hypothetical protein